MSDNMTVLKALSELKLIMDKILKAKAELDKYAVCLTTEKPRRDDQREHCKGLMNSIRDNFNRYLDLKDRIAYTNLMTKVIVNGEEITISRAVTINNMLRQTVRGEKSSLGRGMTSNPLGAKRAAFNFDTVIMNAKHSVTVHNGNRPQGEAPADLEYFIDLKKIEEERDRFEQFLGDLVPVLEAASYNTVLLELPTEVK